MGKGDLVCEERGFLKLPSGRLVKRGSHKTNRGGHKASLTYRNGFAGKYLPSRQQGNQTGETREDDLR